MNIFGLSCRGNRYGYVFVMTSIALLIIAMAGPQIGTEEAAAGKRKADIIIAIDASLSMLARDSDDISRLDEAKKISQNIIQRIQDARVGLIAFAAKPIILLPLTTDADIARTFLERLDADIFWNQGTSIKSALSEGIKMFDLDKDRQKVVILLTDGEDKEGLSKEIIDDIIKKGIKVYTIGVGETQGSKIPIISKEDIFAGYKKDEAGKDVITKLEEGVLKEIAQAIGAGYFRQRDLSPQIFSYELLKGAQIEKTGERTARYKEVFQYPLALAIILLIIGRVNRVVKIQRIAPYQISYYLEKGGEIYGRK